MFNKKHYIMLLTLATVMFCGTFFIVYIFSNMKNDITPENATNLVENEASENIPTSTEDIPEEAAFSVLPSTEVLMVIKDQEDNIISTETMDPYSILGKTAEDLARIFPTYQIVQFDDQRIIIEGSTYIKPEEIKYYLGIQDEEVVIILGNNDSQKIGLHSTEFSSYINTLLSHELIAVTSDEKAFLEQDPYYIERILQNLSE